MSDFPTDRTVVGLKQSIKVIRSGRPETVFLASDASADLVLSVLDACQKAQVTDINRSFTMMQLGAAMKIDVRAAVVVIEKI